MIGDGAGAKNFRWSQSQKFGFRFHSPSLWGKWVNLLVSVAVCVHNFPRLCVDQRFLKLFCTCLTLYPIYHFAITRLFLCNNTVVQIIHFDLLFSPYQIILNPEPKFKIFGCWSWSLSLKFESQSHRGEFSFSGPFWKVCDDWCFFV